METLRDSMDRIVAPFVGKPEVPSVPAKDLISEAFSHLGAAKMQFIDSDDQIIKEHVLAAYELIKAVYWRLR